MHKTGTFRVRCNVANLADSKRSAMVDELAVDISSGHTWLPSNVLEGIGVEPVKEMTIETADGRLATRSIGFAVLRSGKFVTVDEVVFADEGDPIFVGARTMTGFNARVSSPPMKLVTAGPLLAA